MTSARCQILDSFEFAPPAAATNQNAKLKAPLDQQQAARGTTALDCHRAPGRSAPSRSLQDVSRWRRLAGRVRFPRAGLVTFAPGRLRDNARPARWPVCDRVAELGQADAANGRVAAASQEVRLRLSGGVGSLPRAPRWNAVRRARCASARAAPAGAELANTRLAAFRLLFFLWGERQLEWLGSVLAILTRCADRDASGRSTADVVW